VHFETRVRTWRVARLYSAQCSVQWNNSISENVRNRTHVLHIHFFIRMADNMTSQNTNISSWDVLYIFSHHFCIPQQSSNDSLSGPKHVLCWLINICLCCGNTPPSLFVSSTNSLGLWILNTGTKTVRGQHRALIYAYLRSTIVLVTTKPSVSSLPKHLLHKKIIGIMTSQAPN
jgi:hypothetical protein